MTAVLRRSDSERSPAKLGFTGLMARNRPPTRLRKRGKALWKAILGDLAEDWELDAREMHLLERVCRCADELERLEAAIDAEGPTVAGSRGQTVVHPALSEARQLRLVQLRLLSALEIADTEERPVTAASQRARRAADVRWAEHRARRAVADG